MYTPLKLIDDDDMHLHQSLGEIVGDDVGIKVGFSLSTVGCRVVG